MWKCQQQCLDSNYKSFFFFVEGISYQVHSHVCNIETKDDNADEERNGRKLEQRLFR